MASSIKTGLKRVSKKNIGFLIIQADMPLISKNIINSICYAIKNIRKKEIIAPIYKRKMGNPIGFKSSMTKILNKTKGDSGAKKIIKRNKNLSLIKVNSKSIFKDFNTQRDFLLN